MGRIIPDDDLERLKTMSRSEDLPEGLVESYWQFKWFKDALDGSPLGPAEMATIGILAGIKATPSKDRPEKTPFERLKSGLYVDGHPVTVKWRNASVEGEFFGVTASGTAKVRLPGEMEPRDFAAEKVLGVGVLAG